MVVCDQGRSWKGIVERLRLACGWEWSFVTEKVCGCVGGARGGSIRGERVLSACSYCQPLRSKGWLNEFTILIYWIDMMI